MTGHIKILDWSCQGTVALSGKSVALSGNTLTLGNVIPGEPALAIPVTITGKCSGRYEQ